jgi:hypothetical protein
VPQALEPELKFNDTALPVEHRSQKDTEHARAQRAVVGEEVGDP